LFIIREIKCLRKKEFVDFMLTVLRTSKKNIGSVTYNVKLVDFKIQFVTNTTKDVTQR